MPNSNTGVVVTENVENQRLFWRIAFDVFDHEVRLQQIVTCWRSVQRTIEENGNQVTVQHVERGDRKVINLQYQIVGDVTIENDRAVFNGGYLQCESADLTADLTGCPPILETVSTSIKGENVSIRADVKLKESNLGDPYPIFHYPQPDSAVVTLVENVNPANNLNLVTVDWTISGLPIMTGTPFRLEQVEGWHRVRVHQDTSGGGNVFEFWADSAWLGDQPIANASHLFDTSPQTFYIGWDGNLGHGLFGEISHLEFDPNNSCGTCMNIGDVG